MQEEQEGLTKAQMEEINKCASYIYYHRYLGERFHHLIEFDDFKQECYIKVWRSQSNSKSKFKDQAAYSTWVHQVCKNHYLNMIKSIQTLKRGILLSMHSPEDVSQWIEDCGAGQEKDNVPEDMSYVQTQDLVDDVAFEQLRELVFDDAKDKFPEDVWTTFELYTKGLPSDEIANIMDIPNSTVRTRVHRIKQYISGRFQE